MSHSTLILLGATILSLTLFAGSIIDDYNAVLAQEEEEEKEEEGKEEDKEEEEESKGGDEEEKESEESSKEEEESKDSSNEEASNEQKEEEETPPTTETPVQNNTNAIPLIPVPQPQPIANLTGDHILNPVPVPDAIETTIAEPIIKEEFNATCKCMTIPSSGTPTTTPTTPTQSNSQQIPITTANIVDSKSLGQVIDPVYTGFYTVSNLLDNKIDDISFWSQAGKSSFYIKLDNVLDQYQVCSIEANVNKPTNAPFLLDIGVTKEYTGVIDQTTEKIQFDKCVKNMDEILMTIDNPPNTFISLGELKLFGSKVGATDVTPLSPPQTTITPPTLEPQTENANKINIQDSIAEIAIKNSTVTFKFDPMTATFVQQGVK
jgi:hypothetical protein